MNKSITIDKDYPNKEIIVSTKFNAPLNVIWDAFTNPATTDKWWAPKPYKAVTKKMNFTEGGQWLYYMLSPEGEKQWCIGEFSKIKALKSYNVLDAFCDENGNINTNFPRMSWSNSFLEENGLTVVINVISFSTEEDMKQILEMGFEEGYKMGLKQLSELLQKEIKS